MANYYASTRSNYFRVNDEAAFFAWCEKRDLEHWSYTEEDGQIFFAITADTGDCGGWPSYDLDTDTDFEIAGELAAHLDPRDIAILFEVGAEKLRYLHATARAVHADGRVVEFSLHDIYKMAAEEFGPDVNITEGTY